MPSSSPDEVSAAKTRLARRTAHHRPNMRVVDGHVQRLKGRVLASTRRWVLGVGLTTLLMAAFPHLTFGSNFRWLRERKRETPFASSTSKARLSHNHTDAITQIPTHPPSSLTPIAAASMTNIARGRNVLHPHHWFRLRKRAGYAAHVYRCNATPNRRILPMLPPGGVPGWRACAPTRPPDETPPAATARHTQLHSLPLHLVRDHLSRCPTLAARAVGPGAAPASCCRLRPA